MNIEGRTFHSVDKVWTLISGLHQKPSDQFPHCFQKKVYYFYMVFEPDQDLFP